MHMIDHAQHALSALDLAQVQFNASERRLAEYRVEAAGKTYDRAKLLPTLLPRWKFIQDALEGRSTPVAIIEELDRHIAAERSKLSHWTRDGFSVRLVNLRVAKAGEMLAMQAEAA